jgi:hypothetical protein
MLTKKINHNFKTKLIQLKQLIEMDKKKKSQKLMGKTQMHGLKQKKPRLVWA